MLYKTSFYILTFKDKPMQCEHFHIEEDLSAFSCWGKSNEYSGKGVGDIVIDNIADK